MTFEQPILISKIRGIMYVMVGFIFGMGILIFSLVGIDKMISNLMKSPIAFSLTMIFLVELFFILPLILLTFLKKIEFHDEILLINYPFSRRKLIVAYKDIQSLKTYEGDARGISFTEICIRLNNDQKIKFNSISNTNFKNWVLTLSKMIKKE